MTSSLVNEMLKVFAEETSPIIVPVCGGRRGHPLLLAARWREEVLSRHDGLGLRGLLAVHPEQVREVAVTSASVLADMDSPEDYERLRDAGTPGASQQCSE